ncbi:MAG: MFS transporter [Caldilinea sp.]|nr:MFS transporter [Caldilinea sp.]MDW8439396.1 MFS transporter [Caldilineaceae bacterium]
MSVFRRGRFTWLAYLLLAYFSYLQASLGPLMPFLRSELNLSYAQGGLHLSAFAVGMIAAGLSAAALAQRMGRRMVLWGGALGMGLGALLLMSGRHGAITLCAVLLMGYLGALLLIMIQATLSDHHGALRATAFTESNMVAVLCAGLSPLMIGLWEHTPIGWRGAVLMGALALGWLAFFYRHTAIPERPVFTGRRAVSNHLPASFWGLWFVLILCVAMEWCMVAWSADFLHTIVGLPATDAAMLVSVFFIAAALGRFANSRWSLRTSPRVLLLAMLSVVAIGFPIFWLAKSPLWAVIGLGVVGFGVGSLFPLGLSVALTIAAEDAESASGWVSAAIGLAILAAPFSLGVLADHYELTTAFAVLLLFNVVALFITFAVRPEQF